MTDQNTKSELDAAVASAVGGAIGEPVHVERDAEGIAWIQPGTPRAPRCSVCGASRIVGDDGKPKACSLVPGRDGTGGCPDPTFDSDMERARKALARLYRAVKTRVRVADYDGDPDVDVNHAMKMLGVGAPRRRP